MTASTETQVTTELGPRPADAVEELFRDVYPQLAGWVRRFVDDDGTAHEIASEAFRPAAVPVDRGGAPAKLPLHDRHQFDPGSLAQARAGTAGHPQRDRGRAGRTGHLSHPRRGRARPDRDAADAAARPFLLHYYGGLKIREVAELLRRPAGTIKADLFAARASLKTALGDRDD